MIILLGPPTPMYTPFFTFDEKSGFGLSPLSLSFISLSLFARRTRPATFDRASTRGQTRSKAYLFFIFCYFTP